MPSCSTPLLPLLVLALIAVPSGLRAEDGARGAPGDGAETEQAPSPQEDVLTTPVLLGAVAPPVPEGLLEPGGPLRTVVLSLVIDDEGSVIDQQVAASSGLPELDAAALLAAPRLEFLPATLDGTPVLVTIEYPFRFLSPEPPPPAIPPARLSGRVEGRGSKEPIPFFTLALVGATPKPEEERVRVKRRDGVRDEAVNYVLEEEALLQVETDAEGFFAFEEIPPGTWFVVGGSGGYKRVRWLEELEEGTEREVIYRVVPSLGSETVVVARSEPGSPERVITREEIFTLPGAANDPVEAIRSLPGVSYSARQDSSGDVGLVDQAPVVRGAASEDTVAMLDGLPTPLLIHSVGTQTVLGDYLTEQAYLFPAAASAKFGDLTGAVIGLDVRSPRSDRVGGFVQPGFSLAAGAVEGPIADKARFYVGFRRSYYELLFSLVLPPDSPADFATVPFLQDQQAILEGDLLPWMKLQFAYIGAVDGIDILTREDDEGQQEQRFKRNTTMNRFQLKLDLESPEGFTNRLQPALTFWRTLFRLGEDIETTDRHVTFHLLDEAELPLLPWLTVRTGALLEFDSSRRVSRAPRFAREDTGPEVQLDEDSIEVGVDARSRTWFGGWVSAEIRPTDWLRITPEIRLDGFFAVEEFAPQPRAVVAFLPTDWMTWTIAGGRYHQLPSLDELNAITGNPELGTEGAWHANLGLNLRPGPWLDIDLQGYAKFLDDQVVAASDPDDFSDLLEGAGADDAEEDPTHGLSNGGIGRIYGLEVFTRFGVLQGVGISGWLGYSLSWSERRDSEEEDWRWFANDRRHQLTVLLQLKLPAEVSIGARWLLQTGRPRTPIDGSVFYADAGAYIPQYGELYSERSKPYHQLDLRLDKRFRGKAAVVDFFVEATNVYYAKTDDLLIPSYDYREQAGFALIPQVDLGFRLEF